MLWVNRLYTDDITFVIIIHYLFCYCSVLLFQGEDEQDPQQKRTKGTLIDKWIEIIITLNILTTSDHIPSFVLHVVEVTAFYRRDSTWQYRRSCWRFARFCNVSWSGCCCRIHLGLSYLVDRIDRFSFMLSFPSYFTENKNPIPILSCLAVSYLNALYFCCQQDRKSVV